MTTQPRRPRYDQDGDIAACLDCGAFVQDQMAHTRFHSILSSHAWLLAILKSSHLSENLHARYDVAERESRRTFDNWSADALAAVVAGRGAADGGKPLLTGTPGIERRDDATVDLALYADDADYRAQVDSKRDAADGGDHE